MNSALIALFLLASLLQIRGDNYEEEKQKLRQKAMNMLKDCKTKVGASDEDIQKLANKQIPTSKEGLCMLECGFNGAGIMQNGKFDVQNTLKALNPALSKNEVMKKKVTQSLHACEKEIGNGGADRCQTAKLLAQCFQKEAKKSG